jgi:hypothetical protein
MNIIETIAGTIILSPAWPIPAGTPNPLVWAGSPVEWPTTLGQWINNLPAHLGRLWQMAEAVWWPWLPLVALAVVVGIVTVRLAQYALWRRAASGGYWVAIIPPRSVDVARWGLVWRRLQPLAVRARGSWWRLVKPPLSFEVYADGPGLKAGLWLPGWVPLPVVTAEIERAWPGATVHRADPPSVGGHQAVAGVRLAADSYHPETGWLVDDPRPRTGARRATGTDPDLGMVFSTLADPGTETRGRLLLQVLVRPAPGARLARLAAAARHPSEPRHRGGAQRGGEALVWLLQAVLRVVLAVLEVFLSSGSGSGSGSARSSSSAGGRVVPDAIEREAMAEARAKHNDRPHLLAAVRVGASGWRRGQARQAARFVAAGYGEASRWLRLVRLPRAEQALTLRRARRAEWLLLSASELGVLAHLPPDPALYRFDTTALHRPHPGRARRATPEHATGLAPGWTRHGWTTPPDDDSNDDDPDRDDPDQDQGVPEAT